MNKLILSTMAVSAASIYAAKKLEERLKNQEERDGIFNTSTVEDSLCMMLSVAGVLTAFTLPFMILVAINKNN